MTRFIRCSAVDEAAVVDLNTRELTAGYKRAVAASIPENDTSLDAFWCALATAVAGYFTLSGNRARRLSERELERIQQIRALVAALDKELHAIRQLTLWTEPSDRMLSAMSPLKNLAEAYVIGYTTIAPAFRGRNNPHRQFLYGAVLDLWRRGLGQELRYSRSQKGTPGGPLIRFFAACVGPVLGEDAPTAHGIAAIVDCEKARCAAYATSSTRNKF
jgi:hypothetical protein